MTAILKRFRNLIILVLLVGAGFVAYSYFYKPQEDSALLAESASTISPAEQNLITILVELKAITLDASIFADPAFQSLQDFSQALVPEPLGRPNPFAPLGRSAAPTVSPPSSTPAGGSAR